MGVGLSVFLPGIFRFGDGHVCDDAGIKGHLREWNKEEDKQAVCRRVNFMNKNSLL
jgi:hypothetical protein